MLTDMQIPIIPVSDGTTQRLIANIQENTVANKDYYTGDQFILNGVLYKVTKTGSPAIAQGATIDIANDCAVSDTISQQINELLLIEPKVKTYSCEAQSTAVVNWTNEELAKSGYTPLITFARSFGSSNAIVTPLTIEPISTGVSYTIRNLSTNVMSNLNFYIYVLYKKI